MTAVTQPKKRQAMVLLNLAVSVLSVGVAQSHAQRLVVVSPRHHARLAEVLEIPIEDIRKSIPDVEHFSAVNAATNETITTQIYSNPDRPAHDMLLLAIQMPVGGRLAIDFIPSGDSQQNALVFGREAPERKDDFAWENKFVAYRVYGPALEATGEITSGIDVWSKRVPNFVIDSFYRHDAEGARTHNPALSYHKDDGVGLDSYLVGPSRGCGGTGVVSDGKLWVSKNYAHLRQIASGPVRFEFELTYAPWNADGIQVTETKRITLDAGTHMNRIQSTFTFAGPTTIDVAAGLAIHPGADFVSLNSDHILAVWDTPQDASAGRIATGAIAPDESNARVMRLGDQALFVFQVHSGQPIRYLAGSGWSKADMPTRQAWNDYLARTARQARYPLQIHWVKKPIPLKEDRP